MRPYFTPLLKVIVTLFGIYLVLQQINIEDMILIFQQVQWGWVWLAVGLMTASLVIRAYRWQLLLHGMGIFVPFGRLVTIYFIGNFFNAFLPSGFGGDVMRVVEIARDVPTDAAAGTVIVDRLTGLLTLFVMGLLGLPFRPAGFPLAQTWLILSVSLSGIGVGYLLLDGRMIRRWGTRWLPQIISPVGQGTVARLLQAVQASGWPAVWRAMGVSVLFNLILILWWAVSGRALGLTIPFIHYLIVIPILSVVTLIPSIGGLGVVENVAPLLFAPAGIPYEQAVALAFLTFLILRFTSLLGAPVYLWSHWRGRS